MPLPRSLFPLLLLAPAFLLAACSPAVTDAQVKDVELLLEKRRAELSELTARYEALDRESRDLARFAGKSADDLKKAAEFVTEERTELLDLKRQLGERLANVGAQGVSPAADSPDAPPRTDAAPAEDEPAVRVGP